MSMQHANLELNIEQLLLPDLPYGERIQVAAAIEQEIQRLWSEQGVPPGIVGNSLALSMARVQVDAGIPPAAMGAQIAQSLYGQLVGKSQSTLSSSTLSVKGSQV